MTPYRRETLFVHRFKLIDTFAGTVCVGDSRKVNWV